MFEPIWYPIYKDGSKRDFEKSNNLLLDLDEEEEEDQYRRKKYLENVKIKEISFVSAGAVKKEYYIKKGEKEMLEGIKEVEKSDFKWSDNTQRTLMGYSDSDLEEVDEGDLEIEKSSDTNPFPSLARVFNRNKEVLEGAYELATIEERAI